MSQWHDPSDPLHFARLIAHGAPEGCSPKHLLQVYGQSDTWAPPAAQQQFAIAAGTLQAPLDSSATEPDSWGQPAEPTKVKGNVAVGSSLYTVVVRQYRSLAGGEGNAVALDLPSANRDVATFLAEAATGQVPSVGD